MCFNCGCLVAMGRGFYFSACSLQPRATPNHLMFSSSSFVWFFVRFGLIPCSLSLPAHLYTPVSQTPLQDFRRDLSQRSGQHGTVRLILTREFGTPNYTRVASRFATWSTQPSILVTFTTRQFVFGSVSQFYPNHQICGRNMMPKGGSSLEQSVI
jgi:hypothetical protein